MESPIKNAERKIGWYVLGAFVVLVLVFFAGTKFAVNNSTSTQASGSRVAGNAMRGARAGGGLILGSIIKKDDQSITVQSQDGSTKIVFLNSNTKISKTVSGLADDLVIGSNISVSGAANSDGSITGQTLQIRSSQDFMMRTQ